MPINTAKPLDLAARAAAVMKSSGGARAITRAPQSPAEPWPFECPEPSDIAALYAVTDGIELADGTVILPRGGLASATAWLKQERALDDWPDDIIVVGERGDLVITRDLDPGCVRAGGGVLEAPSDSLSTFKRAALSLVGYLEARLAGGRDLDPPPEVLARVAVLAKDEGAIAEAVSMPFYPGAELELARAALTLGEVRAAKGDAAGAIAAFELVVQARVKTVRARSGDAEGAEARAAWRACAIASRRAGSPSISSVCEARADPGRAG